MTRADQQVCFLASKTLLMAHFPFTIITIHEMLLLTLMNRKPTLLWCQTIYSYFVELARGIFIGRAFFKDFKQMNVLRYAN